MFDKFWNPFTLLAGPCTVIYLCTRPGELPVWAILLSYTLWLFLSRFIKYLPHFIRRPVDVIHIPAWIVFNYYFVVMKLYCLATLHITEWGTRKTADAKSAPKMIKESRTVTTIGEDGKEEKTIVEIEVEDKNGNGIEDDDGEEDKDLYVPRYPIYERKPFIISKSSSSNAHSSSSSSRRQVPRRSVMGSLMAGVKRSNAGVTTTTPSINNSSNIKSGLPYSSFSTPTSLGSTRSGYQNLEAKGGVGGMIGVPGPVFSKPSSAAISQRPLLAMAHPSIIHQQSYQSPSNTMTMIAPAAAVGGASLPALGRRNPSTVPPSLTTSSQLNMNTNNNNTTTVNAFQPISILKKKAAASASAKK